MSMSEKNLGSTRFASRAVIRRAAIIFSVASMLGLAACASAPQLPNDKIAQAESAINRAEEARVADYASEDLRAARNKLVEARNLMQKAAVDKDEKAAKKAGWLAEESISDAEVATAKAQEARAKEVNQQMEKAIDSLQQTTPTDY